MAKGSTKVKGVYTYWRIGKSHDSLRCNVQPENSNPIGISAKVSPELRSINRLLKKHKLKKESVEAVAGQEVSALGEHAAEFAMLKQALVEKLKRQYGLQVYKIQERIEIDSKEFDFRASFLRLEKNKKRKSIGRLYRSWLDGFWLRYFNEKGIKHPNELKNYKDDMINHIRTAKTIGRNGTKPKLYSPETYNSITVPFNEWMRMLANPPEEGREPEIHKDRFFVINAEATTEEKKRKLVPNKVRSQEIYTFDDFYFIKKQADLKYKEDTEQKRFAYGILLGIGTGLRRGNLMGVKGDDLFPDADVPYIQTRDNIVAGWSRGEKGTITLENSTKTFYGTAKLPLLQPDTETLVEVARYLKENTPEGEYIFEMYPDTLTKKWRVMCKELRVEFVHPHGWRHSYATNGAQRLHELYNGNVFLFQQCCLHSKIETTLSYVKQSGDNFLKQFRKKAQNL